MRSRARRFLTMLAAAVVVAIAPLADPGVAKADPICPTGTNWDNSIHACK